MPLQSAHELVEIRDVYKVYKRDSFDVPVLNGVSVSVPSGDFLALMGPSGSGKTTLLNLIAGIDRPTSGQVLVDGKEISTLNETKLATWRAAHVGFIFQMYNLIPVLNAFENVELPLLLTHLKKRERREHVEAALNIVGLPDRMTHYPRQLSGGQEQRVAIARAIVTDPAILVADEPTGDLDAKSAHEILDLLQLRSLTNLQIGFRPTSFEEAEDEVIHTTDIHPDGLVQRFWASGSSDSESSSSTISRSWAHALRYSEYDDYDGFSRTTGQAESSVSGSACGTSEHEVLSVVGWEQVKYLAQARLRRPRYTGVVRYDGHATEVAFAPAPTFSPVFLGVPILDLFRRAHDASWRARTIPRSPYDPDIRLDGWTEHAEVRSCGASEERPHQADPSPHSGEPSLSPGPSGQASSPPASPPAFDLPRGVRTDGAKKRSRRRPKRGGPPRA
jgi:putative ABC transport system ATP-binding protein